MRIKHEGVSAGMGPSEKIVKIKTADGHIEEAFMDESFVKGDTVDIPVIREAKDRVLVELPMEAASGAWRLWVPKEKKLAPA